MLRKHCNNDLQSPGMDGLNSEKYPESFLENGLEPSGLDDLWGPFCPTKKTPPQGCGSIPKVVPRVACVHMQPTCNNEKKH
jgi:hypothetical protein